MLHSLKDLEGYAVGAIDGDVGHVKDFYFDDHAWTIRYLVVETSEWLASRKVLIASRAIRSPDWLEKLLPVELTKNQVRHSPDIDTDKPVSRQHEEQYLSYYGYPYYWDGVGIWGGNTHAELFPPSGPVTAEGRKALQKADAIKMRAEQAKHQHDDPHLRSCRQVTGYKVHATDGEIGHVDNFLFDDSNWSIRYLVVNTSNWWLDHKVLLAPQWFKDVNWHKGCISITLNRQSVMDAPIYKSAEALNREREKELYNHYQHVGYWPLEGVGDGGCARKPAIARVPL
ncbi:PRC-barrel domain containing protein [Uliginosibacterium aquaticum]|uniref:PRC-barrel domain-containing protein n=1 Tax=Uliginosibacterium aquaticum TaxID=2731212 RepID=A0ABX2IK75_9RHOO|nr:PRC-barrel domain-containing protein [Uliginosibacterium aquaticum]NSL55074.1 PRC-barrel domain-containing protein [Uliginosibacterium aquaticum]